MLRTKNLAKLDFDLEDTWPNILSSVAFAIRTTCHSTLSASPAQLVFGRDMILPIKFVAEWDLIQKRKQARINASNSRENKTRVNWDFKVGDQVLIYDKDIQRKLDSPTKGPYKITQVFKNGGVQIKTGKVTDERINIRRCIPYHSKCSSS